MASTSTQPFGLDVNMTLRLDPVMTSADAVDITSIAYFPDGQRMISGSRDKTTRQWDLQSGKEIEEARGVCEKEVYAVAVSMDGRWVVTGGGHYAIGGLLKACEVETGIVKTFKGHSKSIDCIDISADSKLLASGSQDETARIWNLGTGNLMAGPFKSVDWVGAVRFSTDSKKLAVNSVAGKCLEVWDIQKQKLDVRIGKEGGWKETYAPIFWTNKNKNILAAFTFTDDDDPNAKTIYEFDASTLETVGTPFKGHTQLVISLALLFDGALLASASYDNTIKLWAFESRQLLASFDVFNVHFLMPSPDSLQLAFTTYGDLEIYICNTISSLLAIPEIQSILPKTDTILRRLLQSDATRGRRPTVVRRTPVKSPVISYPPRHQRPSHTLDHQQPTFLRHVRKLFHFAPSTNAVRHGQPRDPWDFPATSPLPPTHSTSAQAPTQFDHFEISSPPPRSNRVTQFLRQGLSFHRSGSREPQVVEVAAGRKVTRLVAAKLPEYRKVDDTRHPSSQQPGVLQDIDSSDNDSLPDVHWCKAFLCYCSCWSHGRPRMPPRWRLERVDIPRQEGATTSNRAGAHGSS